MFPSLIHHAGRARPDVAAAEDAPRSGGGLGLHGHGGGPSVVLTADPKPRLRWTADLHDRFVDAVAQLGGPDSEHFDSSSPCFFPASFALSASLLLRGHLRPFLDLSVSWFLAHLAALLSSLRLMKCGNWRSGIAASKMCNSPRTLGQLTGTARLFGGGA
jgi:hypothetical protein